VTVHGADRRGCDPAGRPHDLAAAHGGDRARSHCRFVLPLIHFTLDSLTYSVPLFLKRHYDRTLGGDAGDDAGEAEPLHRRGHPPGALQPRARHATRAGADAADHQREGPPLPFPRLLLLAVLHLRPRLLLALLLGVWLVPSKPVIQIEPEMHRVDPESGSALTKALIGIFSQTAGSTCEFWVCPVDFTVVIQIVDVCADLPEDRGHRRHEHRSLPRLLPLHRTRARRRGPA
jgi:hypothetical protein